MDRVTVPTTADRLRAAVAQDGAGSSDFDLNPGTMPEGLALRPAGVLVAVTPAERVILTKRASHLRHHPGQIAFPGGKVDPGDGDEIGAALREAGEEVGLPAGVAEVLGTLPPHRTVTGFSVTPVLALVPAFTFVAEPGEVDEVFEVPLSHLASPANYHVEWRTWRGVKRGYYVVPWGPYYIWGATARMLRVLAERLA
jgi:8-oxo-dGTP pyrophosphatase MutT (NUDIX family)